MLKNYYRRVSWLSILFILTSQAMFMDPLFSKPPNGFKDLVLHLKLDDGAPSSTAADSSDYHLDGQLLNMDDLDWQAGVAGMALSFDGVNDYVEVLDNEALDFGAGNFTVSFWFYKLATASNWSNTYGVNKWKSGAVRGTNEPTGTQALLNQHLIHPGLPIKAQWEVQPVHFLGSLRTGT